MPHVFDVSIVSQVEEILVAAENIEPDGKR